MLTEPEYSVEDAIGLDEKPAVYFGAQPEVTTPEQIVAQFRSAVLAGEDWYLALLEAVRRWRWPQEAVGDRTYRYLIGGEAFDWLLLAERLCEAASDLLPEPEVMDLLFHGRAPVELEPAEFKERLGAGKYRAHLNYLYGVTVEEALQLAVAQEIQKEGLACCCTQDPRTFETIHQRIYNSTDLELLRRFRTERLLAHDHSLSFSEYKEFTYWLFKYRLHHCHRARVASDTKKALEVLQRQRSLLGLEPEIAQMEPVDVEEEEAILL